MSDEITEAAEKDRTEHQAQVVWEAEEKLLASGCGWRNVEGVDHRWVQDVDAVVEHRDDEGEDERDGKLAAIVGSEDSRWAEGIFGVGESLPETKEYDESQSSAKGSNHSDIAGRLVLRRG